MIIQCEQCRAKFRLDDSRVTDKGVKVRCSRCRHLFIVKREQPEIEPENYSSSPEETPALLQEEERLSAPIGPVTADSDFESLDLGDSEAVQPHPAPVPEKEEAAEEPDFSDDDMFWDETPDPEEEPADSSFFDYSDESPGDFEGSGGAEEGAKSSAPVIDGVADGSFTTEETGLHDEPPPVEAEQPDEDQLEALPEITFATPVEFMKRVEPAPFEDIEKIFPRSSVQTGQNDLPPLPISSRRKQSPLFAGLVVAAAVVVVGALGYFGFRVLSGGKEKVVQEGGKISVRAIKAHYVQNVSAGPMLVISGEAVNDYVSPRAALQVKGMIFDDKGQILTSKHAFCGSTLTEQQLATLPLEKIEAGMANQFGDSLVNLEVAPGKAVSFMIVMAAPQKDGKDFGVEPAGSTVASAKLPQ